MGYVIHLTTIYSYRIDVCYCTTHSTISTSDFLHKFLLFTFNHVFLSKIRLDLTFSKPLPKALLRELAIRSPRAKVHVT